MNASGFVLPPCGQAALDFAARGFHVFPVPPGTKESHKAAKYSDGRKWGATTDPDEIARNWRRWPKAGVGLVAGPKSGFFVVEADTAEGHDVDGIGNLAALIEEHGGWEDTIEALSPSGSWHIYFRWPEAGGIFNSASKVAAGVDVRGDGGMVLAPPSSKPGKPQPYRWKNPPGRFGLAECPIWLLQLCREASRKSQASSGTSSGPRAGTGRAAAWAEAALREELANVLSSLQGQRNAALNKAAFALGQIVGGGVLDEADVRSRLVGAGQAVGLETGETEATVASGMAAGIAEPRTPPEERRSHDGGVAGGDEGQAERPAEADEIDLSHDALALELGARSWDRNARHVSLWGQWLFWAECHWARDMTREDFRRVRIYLGTRAREVLDWAERKAETLAAAGDEKAADKLLGWSKNEARMLRHKSTVAAIESLAQSNAASAVRADLFDADTRLLGTPGGTVDLKTGEIRAARREDYITRLTSVAPVQGRPVRWLAFLDEVFQGNQEMIAFLQHAAGYSLTGETREHKLLFCYGGGRNGKGTFLETLFHILGDYGRRIAASALLNSQGEKHPTDLAGLHGARFVVGSELPRGKSWDEAALKDLTGGDVLTARFMRQDFFDFRPQFTLWIAGNTMPSFKGVDEAMRARVVLIPFTVTIPAERRDTLLPEKLRAEAGQILSWAMEGAVEWYRAGLRVPANVAAASREYLDGEDTLGQFLTEETVQDAMAFVTTKDLYHRFGQWAQEQGLHPWTKNTFAKEVAARRGTPTHRNTGNGYTGLRLR